MARFQRARKPEEKEVRRRAILEAARQLARESGPIDLSLNEIARRSGVSKPNIYRYFESREEILFRLYMAETADAVEAIERRLRDARGPHDVASVAAILAQEYLSRPLLCQLAGMVSSILEHNMSVDMIAAMRHGSFTVLPRAVDAVRRALPWLSEADAAMAMQMIALQLAALWPAAHPSSAARQVLSRPEFSSLALEMERDFPRFIQVYLEGLRSMTEQRARPRSHVGRSDRGS
jgi:AcrR family transcriptional regulator